MDKETKKILSETYWIPPRESVKLDSEFLIDADTVYNPKTGEIFRKRKCISKGEAKKMFPDKNESVTK